MSGARGYQATGFRLTLGGLHKIPLPALVHLSVDGDKHFAVITKIRGDQIYLADSSRGNTSLRSGNSAGLPPARAVPNTRRILARRLLTESIVGFCPCSTHAVSAFSAGTISVKKPQWPP